MPDTGAGEKPRSFVVEGKRISVAEIISQRVEEAFEDERQKRCFRVKGMTVLPICFHTSNRQGSGMQNNS